MTSLVTRGLRLGYHGLRAGLFRYAGGDPERVHEDMIRALSHVPAGGRAPVVDPVTVAGVRFPNRVGVAAGLDKDGIAAQAWCRLGFGFAELGTVTALPQPGNPTPRVFRAVASRGIVNRMGFNNHGAEAMAATLRAKGVARGNGALGDPGRHLHRQVQGGGAGPRGRRLPHLPAPAGAPGRLRGRQRVQPQHPRAAQPAGRHRTGRAAAGPHRRGRRAGPRTPGAGVGQAGARSRGGRTSPRPSRSLPTTRGSRGSSPPTPRSPATTSLPATRTSPGRPAASAARR